MEFLVMTEIFETAEVGFLLVGHTHNDVDQIFSRISKRLFATSIYSFEELARKIKESHRQVSQITKKEKKKNYNILIINNHNNIADKRMPVAEKTAGHQDSF